MKITEKIQILLEIANGLHHLHKNHIMHRDVKCENILVFYFNL
jgi:serine/threonine protein kinase